VQLAAGVTSLAASFVPSSTGDPGGASLVVDTRGDGGGMVTSAPAGIACDSACAATFAAGTMVTLTATPDATSVFAGWSGACTADPCTVRVDQLALVTAEFDALRYDVSVDVGAGFGVVFSDPTGIDCGHTCTASVRAGTTITLTETPDTGGSFVQWGGDCSSAGGDQTCSLVVDGDRSVLAQFVSGMVTTNPLLVVIEGDGSGTVSTVDGTINCPDVCGANEPAEVQINLEAAAAPGSVFAGWSGSECSGTNPICSLDADAPRAVVARFDPAPQALDVTVSGAGVVYSAPAGIYCGLACEATFPNGTLVTLTAAGAPLTAWGGACALATGSTCTIAMDADLAVSASF
jgi:hypothetical protein